MPLATATRMDDDTLDHRTPADPIWLVHRAGPLRRRLVDLGGDVGSSAR